MRAFNESFHTNDFDREMLDFIKENYTIDTCNGWYESVSLCYHPLDKDFFILACTASGNNLTKQEFKEKIGMINKSTFTKDDLVAGKHVVECLNGNRYVVLEDNVLLELNSSGWLGLDDFKDDLLFDGDDQWDIVKVYLVQYINIHYSKDLPLVWERAEKSEAQLQYEECQAKMKELQAQLDKLEPQIK